YSTEGDIETVGPSSTPPVSGSLRYRLGRYLEDQNYTFRQLTNLYSMRDIEQFSLLEPWRRGLAVQMIKDVEESPAWAAVPEDLQCRALAEHNASAWTNRSLDTERHRDFLDLTSISASDNCETYKKTMGFFTGEALEFEQTFPLAFSIVIYKDFQMFELLMRAIYRPQNLYCVHMDNTATVEFKQRVTNVSGCFENVFLASQEVNVRWGTMSAFKPDLVCMQDMLRKGGNWKYFINLTGQELPLRTNYELVKILRVLDGKNIIECEQYNEDRIKGAGAPPFGVQAIKGSIHSLLARKFVAFILRNQKSRRIINWAARTYIPDEMTLPTIHCNPSLNAPGGLQEPFRKYRWEVLQRYKVWGKFGLHPCNGKFVRGICIFGPKDFPTLVGRHELFVNKFNLDYNFDVAVCLADTLMKRHVLEYSNLVEFKTSVYDGYPHKVE
ncbi:GCNT1-like protein, partial [Mya arenaria]